MSATGLTAEQLEVRRGRVTGTSAAAILGVHPYKTPLQAYREILGLDTPKVNSAMEWGTRLEPVVAQKWADEHDREIVRCEETLVHPKHDFLAATGDYLIPSLKDDMLDCKTVGERVAQQFGDQYTDQIPDYYLVQGIVEMAVYQKQRVHFPALFLATREYREYLVERNALVEDEIINRLGEWHHRHIVPQIPPQPSDDSELGAYLVARYPKHEREVIQADEELDQLIRDFDKAKEAHKVAEAALAATKTQIQARMKDAGEVIGTSLRCTWRTTKGRTDIDWKSIALGFNPPEELIELHSVHRPDGRSFCGPFKLKE